MDPQSSSNNKDNDNNKKLNNKKRNPNKYRECLKNHAASLGAHALDGCRQYISSPSSDPSDPSSLTCAACACHRNFHRLITVDGNSSNEEEEEEEEEAAGSHVLLTLKTGGGPAPTQLQLQPQPQPQLEGSSSMRRKRYRSKFSKEQKEGMMELAERVGWRLQRRDDEVVEEGCRRVGVERGVFKVWMHNNKQGVMETKRRKKMTMEVENGDDKGVITRVNGGGTAVSDHKDGDHSKTTSTPSN